jgi:hypothetical protein
LCGDTVFDESIAKESIGDAGDGGMHPVLLVQVLFSFLGELADEGFFEYFVVADDCGIQLLVITHKDQLLYIEFGIAESVGAGDWEASSSIASFGLKWYCSGNFEFKI